MSSMDPAQDPSKNPQAQKPTQRKKKATRACIHCQKAHLTCNDSRPCQRCIKRDLASTCTDGARKKAKYLQDTQEIQLEAQQQQQNTAFPPSSVPTGLPDLNTPVDQQSCVSNDGLMSIDSSRLIGMSDYNYGFGSAAANLEYSILSSMLGSPLHGLVDQISNPPQPPFNANTNSNANANAWPQQDVSSSDLSNTKIVSISNTGLDSHGDNSNISNPTPNVQQNTPFLISPAQSDNIQYQNQNQNQLGNQQVPETPGYFGHGKKRTTNVTPEMIYNNIKKPFSYADGFHYLISYVRQKMTREDLMRISRALALFRPSILASMMNLTEHDLIFTERCLQRTLMEYEKLISYSGTPTVVWRRTGEITLVGKEFSLLTQWSRDALLSKKSFIFELMSNPSAVEYWEKYALHAFDNTDSAVYSSCILLSPTKRAIPCTFCFTIKRDIFDLPSVIIGNFLPILS
ncbi:hypothetical protein CLU79DRAFT_757745 [Phycomyces nitens]|nr:hypothetical protein CLU79DRAFT_757745 [Phycomyces nitens]